jgi:hypothetical protein
MDFVLELMNQAKPPKPIGWNIYQSPTKPSSWTGSPPLSLCHQATRPPQACFSNNVDYLGRHDRWCERPSGRSPEAGPVGLAFIICARSPAARLGAAPIRGRVGRGRRARAAARESVVKLHHRGLLGLVAGILSVQPLRTITLFRTWLSGLCPGAVLNRTMMRHIVAAGEGW